MVTKKELIMVAAKDLYVSEKLKDKSDSIIKKLRFGKFVPGVFVIFLNEESGKPEFMKSVFFCQKYLQTIKLTILGITDSYDDAVLYLANSVAKGYKVKVSKENDKEFDLE